MKMKYVLLGLLVSSFVITVTAQQGINYKAIIHDSNGDVLANTLVAVQFNILESGTTNVYQETHNQTTDGNGIIVVNIGEGTPVSGDFNSVNWGSNSHYLNTQIDTGEGLTDMGTTEFKAVPYAIHAKNGFSGSWLDITDKPTNISDFGISDAVSSTGIITGLVDEFGIVISGEHFTVEIVHESGEFFRIHFENAFQNIPAVVANANIDEEQFLNINPTKEYVEFRISRGPSNPITYIPEEISFIVIGDIHRQETPSETVVDADNNIYGVVQIGSQKWMKENLKTTKYNDGAPIAYITDPIDWSNQVNGAYTWFGSESDYGDIFGAYYNWFAVDNGNLCPAGWHVPTDDDWKSLEVFLGMSVDEANSLTDDGNVYIDRGVLAGVGNKLKAKYFWLYPNTGTNESGFSGRPAAFTTGDGFDRDDLNTIGIWWTSSTIDISDNALIRYLFYRYEGVVRLEYPKTYGLSVRCIKD